MKNKTAVAQIKFHNIVLCSGFLGVFLNLFEKQNFVIHRLRGHFYMFDNPHLYSAHDLHKTLNDSLHDVISRAVTSGVDHVLSCQLCSSKGFICEVCPTNEVRRKNTLMPKNI